MVNYNVRYFLEQCLYAVFRSKTNFEYEVFVVDNDSTDDSILMLKNKFPQVILIANTENAGFSKANNQAMRLSNAEYILLLNPDTLIQETTLQQCIDKMDEDKNTGALGVKMVDGSGRFLPESKRGFPSPVAAFSKMSGLSKLFPASKLFGQYHLTYLDKNINHEVDVLSGAFMLLRRSVLDKIGLLDEDYFMYGEDIDLSYRIKQAGYKNIYFADTSIIHFKGESTKKGSLNYIRVFYQAMIIFSQKHVSGSKGKALTIFLQTAIYLRAFMAIIQTLFSGLFYPVVDAIMILGALLLSVRMFENIILSAKHVRYPASFYQINIPLYIGFWLLTLWFWGVYQKGNKWKHLLAGLLSGTVLISLVYSFFPLALRSSRGIILSSFLLNIVFLSSYRFLLTWINGKWSNYVKDEKRYIIIGEGKEAKAISGNLILYNKNRKYIGFVSLKNDREQTDYLGNMESLAEIIEVYSPDELLFSTDTVPMQTIVQAMSKIKGKLDYKLISKNTSIIGSSSKNEGGDVYTFDVDLQNGRSFLQRIRAWL
ncbi:MAG TPA: glycosyltransferase [Chitinophagales bacterium]|nr:glycosyltransferase [Chitinophagales bacterium]HNL83790.1 glycosyltransferase [Chitinophagales bacterium]